MRRPLCEYGHLVDGEVESCGRAATHELPPPPGCYGREPMLLCEDAAGEVGPAAETLRSPTGNDEQQWLPLPKWNAPRDMMPTMAPARVS